MKKLWLLLIMAFIGFNSFGQGHSGYAKLLLSRGFYEYDLPLIDPLLGDFRPGTGFGTELGTNFRIKNFEVSPFAGFMLNTSGYHVQTDSINRRGSFNLRGAYLGLGLNYALKFNRWNIHELLVGGGAFTNLATNLSLKQNGDYWLNERIPASVGGFADIKVRYRTKFRFWIEPSLRIIFQNVDVGETALLQNELNNTAIQGAIAFILPFSPLVEDKR